LSLCAATPAYAGTLTYGSDLSASATIAHNRPNDSVYFNDALAAGNGVDVGVTGQVIEVTIKGRIVPSQQTLNGGGNPFNTVHFQVLRPQGNGQWLVPPGSTSIDYALPWTGDDNQLTTFHTTRQYDALCVRPGDRVDFATLGGYDPDNGYPDGTPFRVFGQVPGSRVLQYSAAGTEGVNNGQVIQPQDAHDGEELLMRFVVGTGDDARAACRDTTDSTPSNSGTTTTRPTTPPVTLPPQRPRLPKSAVLGVAAFCHAVDVCHGKLTATAKRMRIGSARYTIAGHKTASVRFRFNRTGRTLFKQGRNRLKITITAATDPGGPANIDKRTLVITKRT